MLRFKDESEFDAYRRSPAGFADVDILPSETQIQRVVLLALRINPRVAWVQRMNSAAGRLQYADGSTSRFMRFGFPGMSDILGQLRDGRFLAVEVKSPGKKPTDEQRAFLDAVNGAGGLGFWVDDVRQVYAQLPTGADQP